MKIKVPSHALKTGDVVGSGETIVQVWDSVRTPKGKINVGLIKNGLCRNTIWGKYTLINVERPND